MTAVHPLRATLLALAATGTLATAQVAPLKPLPTDAPVLKVTRTSKPADLLKLPDTQVLESPTGERGTVADYKRLLDKRKAKLRASLLNDAALVNKGRIVVDVPDAMPRRFAERVAQANQAARVSRGLPAVELPTPPGGGAGANPNLGRTIDPAVLAAPRVFQVSGQTVAQTWFIPGVAYDIRGQGFGNTPGQVVLLGQFPNGQPTFRIDHWSDKQIFATVDPGVSGALDQDGVTLVVRPAAGAPITSPNGHFWAARANSVLALPRDKATMGNPGGITPSYKQEDGWVKVRRHFAASEDFFSTDDLFGDSFANPLGGCEMAPATDRFDLSALRPGFAVVGFEWVHGRTDSGNHDADGDRGRRYFSPGYDAVASADGKTLDMKWGVFKSYYDPWTPPVPDSWWCNSNYRFRITVQGPAGIAPW